jgi:cytochrome b6-f complex iron-sulfur subunit
MDLLATPLLGPWDYLGIGVGAGVLVVALALVALSLRPGRDPGRRTGRHPARGPGGADPPPAGAGFSRRVLVERGALGVFAAALAGVVSASIDYVVRAVGAEAGRAFTVGTPAAVRDHMRRHGPVYDPVGRFYVVPYPARDLPEARSHYDAAVVDGMEVGFVALDQACTHLGCRVPWCPSSQWFECPCHGSRYNAVGEQRRGPAPRGLDRYRVTIVDGRVTVDTGHKYLGPPPGTDTTGQQATGPHCN